MFHMNRAGTASQVGEHVSLVETILSGGGAMPPVIFT